MLKVTPEVHLELGRQIRPDCFAEWRTLPANDTYNMRHLGSSLVSGSFAELPSVTACRGVQLGMCFLFIDRSSVCFESEQRPAFLATVHPRVRVPSSRGSLPALLLPPPP